MKITVCELQSVMDSAHHFRPSSEDCPSQGNVSYVVGDFFQPDLPKADLYVLCRVLHDWTEDKVDLILSNVYKCLPSGKELLKVVLCYWVCLFPSPKCKMSSIPWSFFSLYRAVILQKRIGIVSHIPFTSLFYRKLIKFNIVIKLS